MNRVLRIGDVSWHYPREWPHVHAHREASKGNPSALDWTELSEVQKEQARRENRELWAQSGIRIEE